MTWAVRFEGVNKTYRGGGARYSSIRHEISEIARRSRQRLRGERVELRGSHALSDVDLEVEEGESFALIGPNGAGKTTALKILSRISYPTSGRVRVRGRVGALIEVGSGVHPELSARENIWLYGQILGMSKADVRRRFDEIVEFAELGHVLERPVKMYSSGMQLRLGFAIASHLDPDVFVVDEALAVGDAGFQAKCVERMAKLVSEGRTLLFVSHAMWAIEAICQRGAFLLDGRVEQIGSAREIVGSYLDWVDRAQQTRTDQSIQVRQSKHMRLTGVSCHGPAGDERYAFVTGEDIEVRLSFDAEVLVRRPYVSVGITDGRIGNLVICSMLIDGIVPEYVEGKTEVVCVLRSVPLLPHVYQLWCSVTGEKGFGDIFDWQAVGSFRISEGPFSAGPAALSHMADSTVHVVSEWEVRPVS